MDKFENIYSLKNIHQFNFESYMNKNNIYECTNGKENQCIKKSDSIKSYIFQKLKEKPLCLLYLYGIYDPDSINLLARLSLPFLVCMHILEKILNTIRTLRPFCPECGEPLIFEGGCNICKSCGYTKCD